MKLTKTERQVMEMLWPSADPMSSSEIADCAEGWKPSYVHLMISSPLKKGIIEIAGFK